MVTKASQTELQQDLGKALIKKDIHVIDSILKQKIDLNFEFYFDHKGESTSVDPMVFAMYQQDFKLFKKLLQAGNNKKKQYDMMPILEMTMMAFGGQKALNLEAVKILLDFRVDPRVGLEFQLGTMFHVLNNLYEVPNALLIR